MAVTIDIGNADLDAMEVDFIGNILKESNRSLADLVKISLCFNNISGHVYEGSPAFERAIDHLIRHNAKYYFQPNQRDAHEQAIVDAFGIASMTKDF